MLLASTDSRLLLPYKANRLSFVLPPVTTSFNPIKSCACNCEILSNPVTSTFVTNGLPATSIRSVSCGYLLKLSSPARFVLF